MINNSFAYQNRETHVHFLRSITSSNDGHHHEFRISVFIENPSGD